MACRAQVHFEAIACILVFFALIGLALAALNQASGFSKEALEALEAKHVSENCCLLADSAFACGINEIFIGTGCISEEGLVKGRSGEMVKESECLARNALSLRKGGRDVLEVELNAHYR
jgi:hypothetical protein